MDETPIRVASMGPADQGKSTLFGYLALQFLDQGKKESYWSQVKKWQQKENWFREDRVYTYLFDRHLVERRGRILCHGEKADDGNSIEQTHLHCRINDRLILLIDVPGHLRYISNATVGIFQAYIGVLVVSARDLKDIIELIKIKLASPNAVLEKKKKIALASIMTFPILAKTYGFRKLIVAISKMDMDDYDHSFFNLAVTDFKELLVKEFCIPEENIVIVPTAVLIKDDSDINVVSQVPKNHPMSWYKGPTLAQVIGTVERLIPSDGPLFMPLETLYWKKVPNASCVLTGHILQGKIQPKQQVKIFPLFDIHRSFDDPKSLIARVIGVQKRDETRRLPWQARLPSDGPKEAAQIGLAGHVVGVSVDFTEKLKGSDFRDYFRRGCALIEKDSETILGNVLRAEIFVPTFCRKPRSGQCWVIYLFGKKRSQARILNDIEMRTGLSDSADPMNQGSLIGIDLLLDFPIALYPEKPGVEMLLKNIVLRDQDSTCGGRVISIYLVGNFRAEVRYNKTLHADDEAEINAFLRKRMSDNKMTLTRVPGQSSDVLELFIEKPGITSDYIDRLFYTLSQLIPKPDSIRILTEPSRQ